jgi:vacuolar-type H+-ATPase subunit I/STV1
MGVEKLAKNPQSKDDALEALDFIVNVLKEHEKDLDKLINELATVTEQIGETGELKGKVEKVEGKIDALQKEVTNLISYLSSAPKQALAEAVAKEQPIEVVSAIADVVQSGPSVILRCSQWEDFQFLALRAQTLSFRYKEEEKVFQSDALKGNQIITYSGVLPKFSCILKMWLSKQLDVPERNILEGILAVS